MPKPLTLKMDGETHNIECNDDETVLEAALRNGLDIPYGCMSGTCNACQAHVNSGTTEMEYCDALTDDEVASGEVLTCQARITSDAAEIEFTL